MAVFRSPLSKGSISDALADFPEQGKSFFRKGFALLNDVPQDKWDAVIEACLESFHLGYSKEVKELASRIGLSEDDTRTILGTVSMTVAVMSSREEPAEEFVRVAAATNILDDETKNSALALVGRLVKKRSWLSEALKKSTMGVEVLPSLDAFEIVVDVRVSFSEENRIEFAVPVAIVHLDTDAPRQEVWFQLTRRQVERMIEDLHETLKRMEEAEKLAAKISDNK